MNRSIRIPIAETAVQLKQMYIQENDKRRAERLQFLYLLKTEQIASFRQGTQILMHHRHTLSRWLNAYEEGGLDKMLERESPPGRNVGVSDELRDTLEEKLSNDGFASYKDAHFFMQEHSYGGDYNSAMHYLKTHHQTRLKVTRPQHVKQNIEERDAFKKNFNQLIAEALGNANDAGCSVHFCDEARFGRMTPMGKRVVKRGVQPVALREMSRENFYIYGTVEPLNGTYLMREYDKMKSEHFQDFLNAFGEKYSVGLHIIVMDGASIHWAKDLHLPKNIRLLKLPPYCPELNPIERVWQHLKKDLKGKIWDKISSLKQEVQRLVKKLDFDVLYTLTAWDWILDAEMAN